MKNIRQSNWKYKYIYFNSRATYQRPADTIIIRFAITPTGRGSKYWAIIRINGTRFPSLSESQLYQFVKKMRLPKLPKGYTWSEPFLY